MTASRRAADRALGPARRLRRRLRAVSRAGRSMIDHWVGRRARDRARRAGAMTRVLVYSPANLNVIDGSSIWVESIAATLAAGPSVWVTVPLKAAERRFLLTDGLRRLDRVDVLPPPTTRGQWRAPLEIPEALDWIERLDVEESFDVFVLRGFELCEAAIERPRLAGRIWSAYILEPERDPDSPSYIARMRAIAGASRAVLTQTPEMRAATEERVPEARGRSILAPPAIPSVGRRADGSPVSRLIYTGKFAPFYPIPELIDAFGRLRIGRPDLEFHLVGDKIWQSPDDTTYADAVRERVATVRGIVWHGGLSRADANRLLSHGGVALSIWDYRYGSHWNDLVVSTKLLDYCAAGLPVILNRTVVQESILGADYPLFVDDVEEAESMIARVLADADLYRSAAARCWEASRAYTYEAVHRHLAPELDRLSLAAGDREPS